MITEWTDESQQHRFSRRPGPEDRCTNCVFGELHAIHAQPAMRERLALNGLALQEERIAAVNAAGTPDELERLNEYYAAAAILAADPVFTKAFEMRWEGIVS